MTFKRAIPKCTPDQQGRQDVIRNLGCIAGRMNWDKRDFSLSCWGMEIHHLTKTGRQIGQDATVCLCQWHHRGICHEGFDTTTMTLTYGPSLAKGSKLFHAQYGDNATLLEYQNNLLKD